MKQFGLNTLLVGAVCLCSSAAPCPAQSSPPTTSTINEQIDALRRKVASHPNDLDTRLLLATQLAVAGARTESLQQAAAAVKLTPGSAPAHNTLAKLLSHFGEFASATTEFEKALQLDPRMADAHLNLALVQAQLGEFPAAASHLRKTIDLLGPVPASAYPRLLQARIYSGQDDLEHACSELRQAVKLRPDFADAWSDLGAVLAAMQLDNEALEALERAVRLNADDAVSRYRLGSQYLYSGKPGEAAVQLKKALELGYQELPALYKLQRALQTAGNQRDAEHAGERLKRLIAENDPANTGAAEELNNRGVALEKEGNLPGAIQKYGQALDLQPHQTVFRVNYGLALCRSGKWTAGAAELNEVLRQDPGNTEAARALSIARDHLIGSTP